MKRKLSLLLSLMMVLTLIPMSSFAATANRVDRVVSVDANGDTSSNSPRLIIEDNKGDIAAKIAGGENQTFRLILGEGATWNYGPGNTLATNNATSEFAITTSRISDRIAEITFTGVGLGADDVAIELDVDFSGAAGAQKVTLDPRDSVVTGGEYTFATAAAGRITAIVDKEINISRGSTANNEVTIILDEINSSSFSDGDRITLRLPREFSWDASTTANLGVTDIVDEIANNGRDLLLEVTGEDDGVLQTIVINSTIRPTRNASFGDVTVNVVRGNVSPSSFVIGKYVDFGTEVKVDKVLDVVSGKNEEALYVAKLIIEEPVTNSLLDGRFVEFSFNKDVAALQNEGSLKITNRTGALGLGLDVSSDLLDSAATATDINGDTYHVEAEINTLDSDDKKIDAYQFDAAVVRRNSGTVASKIEMEIPFVVSAGFEGDVVLTVKGAGIETQELVVAKAVKPVKIEVQENGSADVKIGLQRQSAPDIIITETEAGALSEDVLYTIRNRYEGNITWRAAKIEVIEGDIELDSDTEFVAEGINIKVEGQSTKPSKIKISGVEVTLDRTVPYGPFEVNFNFGDVTEDYKNLSNRVARLPYFNVVTPVQDNQRMTAVFTIGDANYTVNGEAMTLDAAPFISNNRTMLPIGAIAQVVGASVNYSPVTRTAIFTKDGVVVSMTLDQPFLTANGVVIPMDSAPVVVNSRAFVPMAFVAQAFGVPVQYDAAARTVTVN